jgi:hypothetical protein
MAKLVLRDADISVGGVDLSDHASSVTIETTIDEVESTSFGDTHKQVNQGMADGSITVNFHQDFAAASVDATLWPLAQPGAAPVVIIVKPTSAAVGTTNPKYTMTGLPFNYSPLAGSVGELSQTEVTFRNVSSSGITRATT